MNVRDKVIKQYEDLIQEKIADAHKNKTAIDYEEINHIHRAKEDYMRWMPNEVADLLEEAKFLRSDEAHLAKSGDTIQFDTVEQANLYDSGPKSIINLPPEHLSQKIKEKKDLLGNKPTPKEVLSDGVRGEKLAERFAGLKGPKWDDYLKAPKSKVESFQKIRGNSEVDGAAPEGIQTNSDPVKTVESVSDMLKHSAALYDQRNALYGDSYKKQGEVMQILFPNGVNLKSSSDFNRFVVLSTIISKILRYSNNFDEPHDDSVLDNITYCAMLLELDRSLKNEKEQSDQS